MLYGAFHSQQVREDHVAVAAHAYHASHNQIAAFLAVVFVFADIVLSGFDITLCGSWCNTAVLLEYRVEQHNSSVYLIDSAPHVNQRIVCE